PDLAALPPPDDAPTAPVPRCTACHVVLSRWTMTGLCEACATNLGFQHATMPAQRPRLPCARCGGRRIIRIRVRQQGGPGLRSASLTHDVRAEGTVDLDRLRGLLEAYTCRRCGFTEWYAQEPEDIPIGPAYGTELIDLDDDGPYR
ncbi:MAG: hypothetical protein KC464_04520, partial [Myxococcales bacterium]|nr:hypothetical protein [Myxococcales bacterium]